MVRKWGKIRTLFGTDSNTRITWKNSVPYFHMVSNHHDSTFPKPGTYSIHATPTLTAGGRIYLLSFRRDGSTVAHYSRYTRGMMLWELSHVSLVFCFTFLYYNLTSNSRLNNQSAWLSKTGRVNVLSLPLPTLLNLALRSKEKAFSPVLLSCMGNISILHTSTSYRQSPQRTLVETLKNCLWYIWTTYGIFSWKLSVPVNYWGPQ